MNAAHAPLSGVLIDVAKAVVAAQHELDRNAAAAAEDLPMAPLAFVVNRTEVVLRGDLGAQSVNATARRDTALVFALESRVRASLRRSSFAGSSRISISVEAIARANG